MLKRTALLILVVGICSGATCTLQLDDDLFGDTSSYVALDKATATIIISELEGLDEAEVQARVTSQLGLTVQFQRDQAVSVNSQDLTGPDAGYYLGSVTAADTYTVTVSEPTRGVEETTIASSTGSQITSPTTGGDASLSGFTATWSNADPNLTVEITLRQTIFGDEISEQFGPFTDTGSQSFDDDDLKEFRQGADLLITLTRISGRSTINGFKTGTLTVRHYQTITVTPAP